MSDHRGWFADVDPDHGDDRGKWQPCLQLDGMCFSFDVWFSSEEECRDFIRTQILTQGLMS